MSTLYRAIVKLPPSRRVPQFLKECRVVVTRMTGNADFSNPPIDLAVVASHLDDLQKSEELAFRGPVGAVADRDAKREIVRSDIRMLCAFVQNIADADLALGPTIILSAGLSIKKRPMWTKPSFAARYGDVPGKVVLDVRSVGRRASYHWQISTNQTDWTDLPETVESSTSVDGLTPATVYYFRYRTVTRRGLSDWGMVLSVIAH
jgi:hypothetical protein